MTARARKPAARRSYLPAPKWGARPVAVLVGGPHDRRWYFADDIEALRRSVEHFGDAFEYEQTKEFAPHPDFDCAGSVWRFNAKHAAARAARRRDPVAERFVEQRRRHLALGAEVLCRLARSHDRFGADRLADEFEAAGVPEAVRSVVLDNAIDEDLVERDEDDGDFFVSLVRIPERTSA